MLPPWGEGAVLHSAWTIHVYDELPAHLTYVLSDHMYCLTVWPPSFNWSQRDVAVHFCIVVCRGVAGGCTTTDTMLTISRHAYGTYVDAQYLVFLYTFTGPGVT